MSKLWLETIILNWLFTFETVMPKYTGCCCSILKKLVASNVCFIPTRPCFLLTLPKELPSDTPFQALFHGRTGSVKARRGQAHQRGKPATNPLPGLPGGNSSAQPQGSWHKCWREGPDLPTFLKPRICDSSSAASYTVKPSIQSWG